MRFCNQEHLFTRTVQTGTDHVLLTRGQLYRGVNCTLPLDYITWDFTVIDGILQARARGSHCMEAYWCVLASDYVSIMVASYLT